MCHDDQKSINVDDSPGFYAIDHYGFPRAGADDPVDPEEYYPAYLQSERFQRFGYHTEELRGGFHWVTSAGYDAAFVVTEAGVIAIDAPPTLGENMLAAIEEVTDLPVTHVIYSHWHSDHIGAASVFGPDVEIIAHRITKELLERFPDPKRPVPTTVFDTEFVLEVGGARLELSYKGENHCPGNIFIYAPQQKVLTAVDILSPGSATFMHCDASQNITGWYEAHAQILEYDFDFFVGGHHMHYGTREQVKLCVEYFADILEGATAAVERFGRSDALVDILAGAGDLRTFVGVENWINSMANHTTRHVLEKKTSDGRLWWERLAGVSTQTKYHAYTVLESIRLERPRPDYRLRGENPPAFQT
ncbi:MBL fold metallo-hydrolase [Actinoalloteichus hymeniacidonis]|uniref:Zn-dependent hydrolase, glyoxylase n=1 Tax=Actinoalloteichus hymeniacidonis TaxID=340345 RepID=A0AAC9HQF6_9PSEU|nr:MBL fold metallo-hydrolase [Actinoalloteichus hymeniacidonis]AOS63717.1 Zn-dependent hydrolase, glyoxylase [Actinoalloteichus hymeniacidonis]MBB5908230.1 glyoxylase-like metal-dependent hydrolase (beta-lactamase superfamily II) [Actinoalloteichus hymeniacidonis]